MLSWEAIYKIYKMLKIPKPWKSHPTKAHNLKKPNPTAASHNFQIAHKHQPLKNFSTELTKSQMNLSLSTRVDSRRNEKIIKKLSISVRRMKQLIVEIKKQQIVNLPSWSGWNCLFAQQVNVFWVFNKHYDDSYRHQEMTGQSSCDDCEAVCRFGGNW